MSLGYVEPRQPQVAPTPHYQKYLPDARRPSTARKNTIHFQPLRTLWAEGHATAEIGRRLGVSKNTIIGKSNRLDLTARPSPIRHWQLGENGIEQSGGPCVPRLANLVLTLVYAAVAPFFGRPGCRKQSQRRTLPRFRCHFLVEWPMPSFSARTPA